MAIPRRIIRFTLFLLITVVHINCGILNKITCNGNACGSDVVQIETNITCPNNYRLNKNAECVLGATDDDTNIISKCPANYELKDNLCVIINQSCPAGYIDRGNKCVKPHCPTGYKFQLETEQCVYDESICPKDYNFNGITCVPICPYAYKINEDKTMCIYDESTCSPNYVYNGSHCVSKCPPGYHLASEWCVVDSNM